MIEGLGDGCQSPHWAGGKTAPDQSPRSPNRRSSSSPWWGQDYSLDWRSHPGLAETTRPRCSRRQSSLWLLSAQPDIGLGIPAPPALAFGWRLTPLICHPERGPSRAESKDPPTSPESAPELTSLSRLKGSFNFARLGRAPLRMIDERSEPPPECEGGRRGNSEPDIGSRRQYPEQRLTSAAAWTGRLGVTRMNVSVETVVPALPG